MIFDPVLCWVVIQDTLIDLLGPEKHARLKTKTDPATGIVHVEGAKVCPATTSETLKKIFDSGLR